MGFGSFLKKAINPLTPFKAIAGAGKSLARGDIKGALLNSTVGGATMGLGPSFGNKARIEEIRRRVTPFVSDDAKSFFGTQSADDQNAIRQSWGGNEGMMQQWYDNAKSAGAVPAPAPAAAPSAQPSPLPQGGFQAGLADVVSGGFSDPYEAQKQARLGPRQRMM
jgi:hypothetical protein